MSTQFNTQQQMAIDALGQNVIVSASAGAGKTTVLIARLMKRILQDGVRIDEIAAMTFTEAAASEMKTRLLSSLNKENINQSSPFLQEQIAMIETASISTIHSFCLNIIKNYGYVIGLDPKRTENILSPAEASLLKKDAMKEVIELYLGKDKEMTRELLDVFSSNPLNFSGLEDAVFKVADWILERKEAQKAIDEVLLSLSVESFDLLPKKIQDLFFEYHLYHFEMIKEDIKTMLSLLNVDDFGKHVQVLLEKYEAMTHAIQKIHLKDLSFYDEMLSLFDFKTPSFKDSEIYDLARNSLTETINTLVSNYIPLDQELKLQNKNFNRLQFLFKMSTDFIDVLNRMKSENACLDFSDFEIMALTILKLNDNAVAKIIKKKYKEIMVDEFQDTNEYQDEIIRMISNGNNIFRVGDIKQSIYRFRGAKPQIMQDLINEGAGLNLFLSFNYRSKKDIVEYNNDVFSKLMNIRNESIYDENDHVNVGLESQANNSVPVEVHVIERGDGVYTSNNNAQTAQHISQEIIRHHKAGMNFKDMVVLVRSHNAKNFLKEAFEEANIPHFLNELSGFYNSTIIQATIHFLKFGLNKNNYDLAFVLNSPFFQMSENRLAQLSLHNRNLKDSLKDLEPEVYKQVMELVLPWSKGDIVSIIQDIISFNNQYNQTFSIQDKTNMDFLLEKAVLYQQNKTPSLYGFIQFIEEFKDEKSSEASPLSSDADVVSALTIHQSKGLQFPLVFIFGIGGHNVMDHKDSLLIDDEMGPSLVQIDLPYRETRKGLLRTLTEYKQDLEEIDEAMRLLYVALTRSQDKMIIVDTVKEMPNQDLSLSLLRNHKRKIELILASNPKNTMIKTIQAMDIEDNSLEEDVLESLELSFTKQFTYKETDFIPQIMNESLNFTSKIGMSYGTILHETIEIMPLNAWESDSLDHLEPSMREKLFKYNQNSFTQALYDYENIYHEMPYLVNIPESSNGIIDFLAVNDDSVVLVDFKSDNASKEELKERYFEQIERYKNALSIMYPEHQIKSFIYSFSLNEYMSI